MIITKNLAIVRNGLKFKWVEKDPFKPSSLVVAIASLVTVGITTSILFGPLS